METKEPAINNTPMGQSIIPSDLPLRKWLFLWLLSPRQEGNFHKVIDRWISLLIVVNLVALVAEHIPSIYTPFTAWFHAFDVFSVTIFTLEYLLRLYLAPEDEEFKAAHRPRVRYALSPFALIDLIAVLPFYLQAFIPLDLRALRLLRLLRILKLFRVLVPAFHEFKQANQGRTFRQKVHALVFPSSFGGELHHIFDNFIVFG